MQKPVKSTCRFYWVRSSSVLTTLPLVSCFRCSMFDSVILPPMVQHGNGKGGGKGRRQSKPSHGSGMCSSSHRVCTVRTAPRNRTE